MTIENIFGASPDFSRSYVRFKLFLLRHLATLDTRSRFGSAAAIRPGAHPD
jgi:hypothetical protein